MHRALQSSHGNKFQANKFAQRAVLTSQDKLLNCYIHFTIYTAAFQLYYVVYLWDDLHQNIYTNKDCKQYAGYAVYRKGFI